MTSHRLASMRLIAYMQIRFQADWAQSYLTKRRISFCSTLFRRRQVQSICDRYCRTSTTNPTEATAESLSASQFVIWMQP